VSAFKAENQRADVGGRTTSDSNDNGIDSKIVVGAVQPSTSWTHAATYELRAYHVWHTNKDLPIAEIAKMLRTPPLKTGTVANYISCAVKKEKLPVDRRRYNEEVVELLPEKSRKAARMS
jgi:hypothetical protein